MLLSGSILYEDLKSKNISEIIKIHNAVVKIEKKRDDIFNKKFGMKKNIGR